MRVIKHIERGALLQEQNRDRLIRTAFVSAPGALSARPVAARFTLTNAARGSNPATPWQSTQSAMRACAEEAKKTGNALIISETKVRIEAFYAACLEDALACIPDCTDDLGIVQALIDETEKQGAADVSAAELLSLPTDRTRLEKFVSAGSCHLRTLGAAVKRAKRMLVRTNGRSLPMSAVR